NRPSAVTRAVISTGASRSRAPRKTSSGPHGIPSASCRCCQCDTIMMLFRVVIPNRVTKPISEPTSSTPPARNTAATPPTSAEGGVAAPHRPPPPPPEHRPQRQQDAREPRRAEPQQLALGGAAGGVLPGEGVIRPLRQGQPRHAPLRLVHERAEVA